MKRTITAVLMTAMLLTGCSRETQVWLPEEVTVRQDGEVVRIPMGEETEPTAAQQPTPPEETEAPETRPPEQVTVTQKPSTAKKKPTGSSGNKETVAATEKPVPTEPPATEPLAYDISGYRPGNLEYEMLDRINAYRTEAGLESLTMDTGLCAIASYRSFEASQVWSHTRPDGRDYATVLDDYGFAAGKVAELLVYDAGTGDGAAMAERWMESKQQQQLLDEYTTAGIGIYRVNGLTYVTCLLTK